MIALAQKEGKVCAWIDSEMSYSEDWAKQLGVDPTKLIYSQARTISDMVDVGVGLMNAGVDLIVVDSITSMLPAIYFEKDSDEMKALENTKQIGAESRDFSNAWKMLNYANNKVKPTLLVLISQSRNNINAMYTSQQPSGGQATKFYSSCIIKLFSSESDNQAIKGKIKVGDKLVTESLEEIEVFSITLEGSAIDTVEIDVEDRDFYFADGILAHNLPAPITSSAYK
jgi:RecA/RadA recombinase